MTKTAAAAGYEVCWDDSAAVWEAYKVDGDQWIWIGSFETRAEAIAATHKGWRFSA